MTRRPSNNYPQYHAHVYFDAATVATASAICQRAGEQFDLVVGRVHEKLVGPHPRWSCQLAFSAEVFDDLIPWLNAERAGLSVLVHGVTGDDLADHTTHATWLGEAVTLNLSVFEKTQD